MTTEKQNKYKKNITLVGLASFFGGISQDMVVPIIPVYLASVLGMPKTMIGLSEGVLMAGASAFKIIAGWLSDKYRTQKPFIIFGYATSMLSRALLAAFASFGAVSALRFLDGVGKGTKDAPKSALLANSTEQKTRGKSFGITRALDTLGSVVGPVLLYIGLRFFGTGASGYKTIFLLAAIPVFITIIIFAFFISEPPVAEKKQTTVVAPLPRAFYIFIAIVGIFTLGNSSDAFLLLRTQELGVQVLMIPLVYALFNFIYASASIPLGSLSDKIGRINVILLGWIAYAIAYLGFANATQSWHAWVLFGFYGLYYATTEGVAKAFVADLVPQDRRGTAYGIYNTSIGLLALPASFIAGLAWDHIGVSAPFYIGASTACVAATALLLFQPKPKGLF